MSSLSVMVPFHPASAWAAVARLVLLALVPCVDRVGVSASGLELVGVQEGARIRIPSGATGVEIGISAVPTGSGSGNVEWVLEGRGSVLQTRTSGVSTLVSFAGLTPGKYYLSARRVGSGDFGDVSFDLVAGAEPPSNDSWAGAVPITRGVVLQADNRPATRETGEPHLTWNQAGKTVWWVWTAPDSGISTATTRGSGIDTVLGVFSGAGLATLRTLGVSDDVGSQALSQVTFEHVAGNAYYLAVDGAGGAAAGPISLQIVSGGPPRISQTMPSDGAVAVVPTASATTNLTLAVSVEGELDAAGLTSVLVSDSGDIRTSGVPQAGTWTEAGVGVGEYHWVVQGTDPRGLVGVARAGFSVVTSESEVQWAEADPMQPGLVSLLIRGMPGRAVRMETSSDLMQWNLGARWTAFDGWVRIVDTNLPLPNVRFYRARNE